MTRPDALEVANEFRRALLGRERDAAARMVKTYGQLHRRLLTEMEAVAAKIAEAEKDGLTVSPAWLWQQDRYQAMLRTADREMSEFAQVLRGRGRADARYALSLGQGESKELVQATLAGMPRAERAALMARWGTLDTRALEQMVGIMDPASPVWQSLGRFGPAMRQRIQDVVTQSLAMGYNPNRWARDLRRVTGEGLDWALNWSRTLQLQAYRESTRQAYIQNQSVVRGWTWSATKDSRVCMSCLVMDGTHHPLSERLDDHWRGRCLISGQLVDTQYGLVPIEHIRTGDQVLTHLGNWREVLAVSARPYTGEVVELGALTVTPEHPVLTSRGWLEAKAVTAADTLRTKVDILQRLSRCNVVQPTDFRSASLRASWGRFVGELCQRESNSTARRISGKAKSILNTSTANWGAGYNPTPFRALSRVISLALVNLCHSRARVLAAEMSCLCECPPVLKASRKPGLAAQERRRASDGDTGAMPALRMNLMRVRVLMPSWAQISRYVARSSTYLRRNHWQNGSPTLALNSASNVACSTLPRAWGDFLSPKVLAWWSTAFVVRPAKSLAMSAARLCQKLARMISFSRSVQKYSIPTPSYGSSIHQTGTKVKRVAYAGLVYNLDVEGDHTYIANGIIVHNCAMLPDTDTEFPDEVKARDWFEQQDAATQRAMMGNAKYDAWKDGRFELDALTRQVPDDTWGTMRVVTPLQDLGVTVE